MLVSLPDGQRQELGIKLRRYVELGTGIQGRAPDWWEACERMHRNEGPALSVAADDNGMPQFHIPFSQPRQDMLAAQVCAVLTKQDPAMLCDADEDDADAMQEALHKIWYRAHFEAKARNACTIATNTDLVHWRFALTGPATVEISVHHPKDFVVYPATLAGLENSVVCGHRLSKRKRQITDAQDGQTYYKGDAPVAGDEPEEDDRTGAATHAGVTQEAPPDEENRMVELWDLVCLLDIGKGERRYRATLAFDDSMLLALEEYPWSTPWYCDSRLIGDPLLYYGGRSVARNLYPLQTAYDNLWSGFYSGAMMSAFPPVIGPRLGSGEKYSKYAAGDYIESDDPVTPWSPTPRFQGGPFPAMVEALEKLGDQVARIGQNTMGAQAQGDTTATEQSIIAAGVAVGVEDYIANFTEQLPRMAALTMEYVAHDYQAFANEFGEDDGVEPIDPSAPLPPHMILPPEMMGGMQ